MLVGEAGAGWEDVLPSSAVGNEKRPARHGFRRTVQSAKSAEKIDPTTGVLLQQVQSAILNVCVAVGLLCLHIAVGIKLAHLGRIRRDVSGSECRKATRPDLG